jgi:thiamine-monophosphate kinase
LEAIWQDHAPLKALCLRPLIGHEVAMSGERDFIERLRAIATDPGARGLLDDAALLGVGGARLIITHDMLVEGVHFLGSDPPESVAAKLVAVNLSDLAAKGAVPVAAILGYTLAGDSEWDAGFVRGLAEACARYAVPLLGGDTVSAGQRVLGLTVIGEAGDIVPSRAGARPGDALFVTGAIGDAGAGLKLAQDGERTPPALIAAYQTPVPQLTAGQALAPCVTAMMDVSDGLLIDTSRLAEASGCAVMLDLDAVPLSPDYLAIDGQGRAARLKAATAGDDYQLLFTANRPLPSLGCPVTRIGQMVAGTGLHLHDGAGAVPLPTRLGWLHGLP